MITYRIHVFRGASHSLVIRRNEGIEVGVRAMPLKHKGTTKLIALLSIRMRFTR